jgi:S1-C subfamily serine protease
MERSKYDFQAVKTVVAIAVVSLIARQGAAQSPGHDVADALRLNVVKIEAAFADHTENGFGFIVGERGQDLFIATAYHVVSPPEGGDLTPPKVTVQFYDHQGTSVAATVLGTHDVAHDLGVLTVVPPRDFEWKKHCLGRTAEEKLGTEVWNVGKTGKWTVPISPGHIANEVFIDGIIKVETLPIQPGSSGGPLIAPSGIIGLILRDDASNATALSIAYVKTMFEEWVHPWNAAVTEAATPPPVVAQAKPPAPQPAQATPPVVAQAQPPAQAPPASSPAAATGEPAAPQTPRQSRMSSTATSQILGALVGGYISTRSTTTDRCQSGYIWREAQPNDHVCVTPETRQRTANENASAAGRADPRGAYGRDTCLTGYVWREAFQGDHVCVSGESRRQAAADNRYAGSRTAH